MRSVLSDVMSEVDDLSDLESDAKLIWFNGEWTERIANELQDQGIHVWA